MPRRPEDIDISVRASRRPNRRIFNGAFEIDPPQRCEHADCDRPGNYRAPYSPREPYRYRWFCLDHVRAYNAAWDSFRGLSQAEIEEGLRSGSTWDRPTWRFGQQPLGGDPRRARDPFDLDAVLGAKRAAPERRINPDLARAMRVLGIEAKATKAEAKAAYKAALKQYHPDLNGGDRSTEGQLNLVIWAWGLIRESTFFADR